MNARNHLHRPEQCVEKLDALLELEPGNLAAKKMKQEVLRTRI